MVYYLTLETLVWLSWQSSSLVMSRSPVRIRPQAPKNSTHRGAVFGLPKSLSLRASPQTGAAIRFQNAQFLRLFAGLQLKDYGFPRRFAPRSKCPWGTPRNDRDGFPDKLKTAPDRVLLSDCRKACHCEPVRAAKQVPLGYRLAWQFVSKTHNSCTFPQIPS